MSTTSIRIPFLHSDGLTRAGRHIALAVKSSENLAVLLVHVHGIERLCATVGHQRAAEMLGMFHSQLLSIARQDDAIERIGDRKFIVMLHGLRNRGHVSLAAKKIERMAQQTIASEIEKSALRTTIGVVMCPEQGNDAHEIIRSAEVASLAGSRKQESVNFFETQAAEQLFVDWGLEGRLAAALESGDLELFYQPKICLRTNAIVGAEALMRWQEPEIGTISPDVFISLAEQTGQIAELTNFAIQRACRQLNEWQDSLPGLTMAVNITPTIIQNAEIVDVLQSAANIWSVPPGHLTMEVTENALMADRDASHVVLTRIREFGARVSIDDFGTGYSSLAYLKEIPADELKIDRSFVMGMLADSGDYKIVEHSIRIAESFGLSVVAEGIESAALLAELRKLGCNYGQGFFISKPVPASEFETLCRKSAGAKSLNH